MHVKHKLNKGSSQSCTCCYLYVTHLLLPQVGCSTEPTPCPTDWFYQCQDDGGCIYRQWLCDGDLDCASGEDERNCSATTTSPRSTPSADSCDIYPSSFRCMDGRGCVPFWMLCDTIDDCVDGSDELDCFIDWMTTTTARKRIARLCLDPQA